MCDQAQEFEPFLNLTEEDKILSTKLIDICKQRIKPTAAVTDRTYEFPRKNLELLNQELGILGILIPKDLNGIGGNSTTAGMIVETIARYGCPSTALVYVMHVMSLAGILPFCAENPLVRNLIKRVKDENLIGSSAFSDTTSGGHVFYPLSSVCREEEGRFRFIKYGSWCTSAGYADYYNVIGSSPNDEQTNSAYIIFKEHVRTYSSEWRSMGLRGNNAGPYIMEGLIDKQQLVGDAGRGTELLMAYAFTVIYLFACVPIGIAMAAMDIAKDHVNRRMLSDIRQSLSDYAGIQDSFGSSIAKIYTARSAIYSYMTMLNQAIDESKAPMDKDRIQKLTSLVPHAFIAKLEGSRVGPEVCQAMMRACGGTAYKEELGIERLFRDSQAIWLMSPSTEQMTNMLGQVYLKGPDAIQLKEPPPNMDIIYSEIQKMDVPTKTKLSNQLFRMAEEESNKLGETKSNPKWSVEGDSIYNPFHNNPPSIPKNKLSALNPSSFIEVKLLEKHTISKDGSILLFKFTLPQSDILGCYPGQSVQIRMKVMNGCMEYKYRYYSPISFQSGILELIVKLEETGDASKVMKELSTGEILEIRGPCGGFEYFPNRLGNLILIGSGVGSAPLIQIVRSIIHQRPIDKTALTMFSIGDTFDDVILGKEMQDYAERDLYFKFIPVLQSSSGLSTYYEVGNLDAEKLKKNLPTLETLDFNNTKVLLCGNASLIFTSVNTLYKLGFPSHCIFVYGPFGSRIVKRIYGDMATLSNHSLISLPEL